MGYLQKVLQTLSKFGIVQSKRGRIGGVRLGRKKVTLLDLWSVSCGEIDTVNSPVPALKKCPECGEEVEIWSDELKAKCTQCGATVFREAIPSCIDWCASARQCLGEERWQQLMGDRK